MFFVIIFSSLFISNVTTASKFNFTAEMQKIRRDEDCKKNCYFEQEEITERTLEKWPTNCSEVCTLMVLNQNTNVSVDVWKEKLKKLKKMFGGIRIDNTSFVNLDFFERTNFDVFYGHYTIINNQKLENADIIMKKLANNYMGVGSALITDNPRFDATLFCDSDEFDKKWWTIQGNRVNCHCRAEKLNSRNLGKYTDCVHIGGSLIITDLEDKIPSMSKVKRIGGTLEVRNTNLKNLSFFESLNTISYTSTISDYKVIIDIHDNLEMTRLGIDSLKVLGYYEFGGYVLNFKNLHPDFCLSVREMSLFVGYKVTFRNIHANLCQDLSWSIDQPKLCLFDKMSNLDTECVFIFGNLLIGPGDEEHIRKLRMVRRVFGYVKIWNTTLENCHFLRQLENVVNLDDSVPVMQFLGNLKLEKLEFPFLKAFVTKGNNRVMIEGNHSNIFKKIQSCITFQTHAKTVVVYNGKDCKSVNRTKPSNHGTDYYYDDSTYSDDFDYLNTWKEYDGDYGWIDEEDYKEAIITLDTVNDIIAVVGLIINFLHLIVLLQKELRGNFVYIIMIGISLCDFILVSTFLMAYLLEKVMGPDTKYCYTWPYWYAMFKLLYDRFLSMARRCSTILAFLMALFRTITVMFPLSITVPKVTRPRVIIVLSLACFGVCVAWDAMLVARCEIVKPDFGCANHPKAPIMYYYQCPEDDKYDDDKIQVDKTSNLFEGFSTVLISVLYLTVTIALSYQLIAARKRRRSLNSETPENTLLLVTVLAVSFFMSEVIFGAVYIIKDVLIVDSDNLRTLLSKFQILSWTFLIINSSIHCLICFFMSAQYRAVARQVFWFSKKKNQVNVV